MKKYIDAVNDVRSGNANGNVYVPSIQKIEDDIYFVFKEGIAKKLVVLADKSAIVNDFNVAESIEFEGKLIAVMEMDHENRLVMARRFDWMNPVPRFEYDYSFGLGDRLGLASTAHLRLFKGRGVLPVLAQQSIRELNLTGRTFFDVIDSASWAAFEEGYTDGFSADGDHLKTPFEVEYAVQCGFPMITLDCSEHIKNEVADYSDEQLLAAYNELGEDLRAYYNDTYANQTFKVHGDVEIHFDEKSLMQTVLIFSDALEFAEAMHTRFVVPNNMDFEVSIDETIVPTTPVNHYFIANEFATKGVVVETMAPKFHGEFQKAIDYVGDLERFEAEYIVHEAIAKHFGYRLSIHSGSDKFSVFPIIGTLSKEGWHVKTAGTNWLEALKVIAKNDPEFMIEIYAYALANLDKAKAYYVIHGTRENSLPLASITPENVMDTLVDDMSRQVLHVTYGLILNEKKDHEYVFKNRIYNLLETHLEDYATFLNTHIDKHLSLLGK